MQKELTDHDLKLLAEENIHVWLKLYGIKNENGDLLDFKDHLFLVEPYEDLSPKQVIFKAAQIGFSTLAVIKSLWAIKHLGINAIYTLPTADDRNIFVGDKVNRILAQNPILLEYTKDKDSVESKQVGKNVIHYRGTFTQKAATMVSSDLNIYDEVDASNQAVVEQYSTRLQHSKYKFEWYFSHPSATGTGVDKYWNRSDQKHWFITCSSCSKEQYMEWPKSVDMDRKCFQCKHCKVELTREDRRVGRWVQKKKNMDFSGYWIPLLICPWVSAAEIIGYYNDKTEEYFVNKVLGLPYVGGGNKLEKSMLLQNLTDDILTPGRNERVVIGMDTGKRLHYVVGGLKGLFYYDEATDYDEIEALMLRWPKAIVVVDQGGDLIGSRKLREKYPGRVFLCSYGEDRKTQELVRWGKNDEEGAVIADRNRMIQLVVDEFTDERIPLQGNENDWYDYWLHWNNLTRIKEENDRGMIRKIWVRSGDDHWAHATTYWRIGMMRFGNGSGALISQDSPINAPIAPSVSPDNRVPNLSRPKYYGDD